MIPDRNTRRVWAAMKDGVSVRELSHRTRLTHETVARALSALETLGAIKQERSTASGIVSPRGR